MEIIYSIIAGVIQGLTEFLPISSSGHLVLFHDFLGFDFVDNLSFDVVLHLGTLVALVLFFWRDISDYAKAWLQSFTAWDLKNNIRQRLAWYILIATLPAAIVGYFLEEPIENVFRDSFLVAAMLIGFGVILYLADRFSAKSAGIEQLNLKSSFLIGIGQAIALIPGVSRSGITIIAGLSQKLNREASARFSFLLSIPIVFAAGLKKMLGLSNHPLENFDMILLSVGFLASAITGYLCIKYFLQFLQKHSLKVFAYYRIILGIIIIFLLWRS